MKVFSHYYEPGFYWFRIFGKGFAFKNIKKHRMLFSERNRLEKYILIGNILIKKCRPFTQL